MRIWLEEAATYTLSNIICNIIWKMEKDINNYNLRTGRKKMKAIIHVNKYSEFGADFLPFITLQ